jgi:hypothetical protein
MFTRGMGMMMPLVEITVRDPVVAKRARAVFGSHSGFTVRECSCIGDAKPTTIIVPGNSFGEINGDVMEFLNAEAQIKNTIGEKFAGELPVGGCLVITPELVQQPTRLLYAPVRRIDEDVSKTINVYLAFRNALVAFLLLNDNDDEKGDDSQSTDQTTTTTTTTTTITTRTITCPMFQCMDVFRACKQMREAYDSIASGSLIDRDWMVYKRHHERLMSLE